MALNSGKSNYTNSMAQAMEQAFEQLWPSFMDNQPFPGSNPQMKLMFLAISRGVIDHLTANGSAFQVNFGLDGGHNHGINNTTGRHEHTVQVSINGE